MSNMFPDLPDTVAFVFLAQVEEFLGLFPVRIPVAARSKTSVCGRSLAEIAGSNPARSMGICLL
jgi:hypothetical protein